MLFDLEKSRLNQIRNSTKKQILCENHLYIYLSYSKKKLTVFLLNSYLLLSSKTTLAHSIPYNTSTNLALTIQIQMDKVIKIRIEGKKESKCSNTDVYSDV